MGTRPEAISLFLMLKSLEAAPSGDWLVLVMPELTKRTAATDAGVVGLVGASRENIATNTYQLLDNEEQWETMMAAENPFGDANATSLIASIFAGKGNGLLA